SCTALPPAQGSAAPSGEQTLGSWAVPALPRVAPIPREEYQARRAALAARMEDGLLVVFGSGEPSADYLPFAQDVAFRYLTGVVEPGAALLIRKEGGDVDEQLFVLPRDPAREVWEGPRLGAEGAAASTGIRARSSTAFSAALDSLAARAPRLYTVGPLPEDPGLLGIETPGQQVVARLKARHPNLQTISLTDALNRARAAKSPAEIDRLRRSIYITSLAQRAAIQTLEPGMNEFEIQALVEYTFRRNGAERPSFATIIGSGPNSTTLHYRSADRFIQAGETVVMDIGSSYDGYAADVTRTVPASGHFTPEQREVYGIVLAAQKAAEERIRVGATWQDLNREATRTLSEGLARLGLIESPTATFQCTATGPPCPQYRLFYMHGLGHGIGLEVHDPDVSSFGTFRAGSVFTIEPGIYVRGDALDHLPDTPANRALVQRLRPAVQRFRNIGVRIEDDYLVTPSGSERLTAGAPREVAEIEALMRLPPLSAGERRDEVVEWYRSLRAR
ncbi:MAG: aminopeptidase P family protein, partial [Gemmatimonadetes bacterium]|nr:aminopeptidase P family protein [Gemmatimonadota bacterium]